MDEQIYKRSRALLRSRIVACVWTGTPPWGEGGVFRPPSLDEPAEAVVGSQRSAGEKFFKSREALM